jgi:hypothetical protein
VKDGIVVVEYVVRVVDIEDIDGDKIGVRMIVVRVDG